MGVEQRRARTEAADAVCREEYRKAGGSGTRVALVAVGGFGRGELAPYSDLDVVLVADDTVDDAGIAPLAQGLFPRLREAGYDVDHAVRTLTQMREVAAGDVRTAMGLLDVRHLAGDSHLTLRLRTELLADWRRAARTRVPEVVELSRRRHRVVGELAHLSVPDLKEAAGGLRDAVVLRALVATWLVDVAHTDLERCRTALLDVRDHLHEAYGRRGDRIQPEVWAELAGRLDLPDAEAAQRHVRHHARRLAHLTRLTWRRAEAVVDARPRSGPRRPRLTPVAPGVALAGGEIVLDRNADVARDPFLLLRVACEAAIRDLPASPATVARLVSAAPPLPEPWPAAARDLWVRLLAAGDGLRGVWETLEETGALERLLPEWEHVRLLPHASAIHRFTVDRHLVETCVEASRLIRTVSRPDLLTVAALLHDVGKGRNGVGDHSVVGEPVARAAAVRMGFAAADADVVASLVRHHLLLPQVAVGRDLDDPATAAQVAGQVRTPLALELLVALTEADARATSAQAWTRWRSRLVVDLATRVAVALAGAAPDGDLQVGADDEVEVPPDLVAGRSAVWFGVEDHEHGCRVTVVAPDRVGLLADVAAVLGLRRVSVRTVRARAQVDGDREWGVSVWEVDRDHLDARVLRQRYEALRRDPASVARLHRGVADVLDPTVAVRPGASHSATVLEVRATDRPGLLHRVLSVVAERGLSVRSAHVDTLGPQAVDVFYLCEVGAGVLADERAAEAANAVRTALTGERGQ